MEGIKYYNVQSEPFKIYGVYFSEAEGHYRRIPKEIAEATNDGVKGLSKHTAGGRVRFATDSTKLVIKAENIDGGQMFHATPLMEYGFDIYLDTPNGSKFMGSISPHFPKDARTSLRSVCLRETSSLQLFFRFTGALKALK